MKNFLLGLVAGLALGSVVTYIVADLCWPKVKIQVHSGPNPYYRPVPIIPIR